MQDFTLMKFQVYIAFLESYVGIACFAVSVSGLFKFSFMLISIEKDLLSEISVDDIIPFLVKKNQQGLPKPSLLFDPFDYVSGLSRSV